MRVLIVGHTGQDGTLLRESLERRGDQVFGVSRTAIYPDPIPGCPPAWIAGDPDVVRDFVVAVRPAEIYYLAAYHTSSEGSDALSAVEAYGLSHETHVVGLLHVLEAVAECVPACRIFYAASSLVYDGEHGEVQDELTPFNPSGFYGMTKVLGIWLCREFRRNRGVFVSAGILYNHESPYRAAHFLSQKIVKTAARIAAGSAERLRLGDISARVDWGYAGDYVVAFQKILALPAGDDFVIATGEAHSVQEFAELSFARFGLDWRDHTELNPGVLTRRLNVRIGDSRKLRATSGWKPTLDFPGLIDLLVTAEQARILPLRPDQKP